VTGASRPPRPLLRSGNSDRLGGSLFPLTPSPPGCPLGTDGANAVMATCYGDVIRRGIVVAIDRARQSLFPGERCMTEPIEATSDAPSSGPMPLIAALVALVLGAAAGFFVVAPKLGGGAAPSAEASGLVDDGHGNMVPAKGHFFDLTNVIVNPAGSQGARFIVVSVSFEVATEDQQLDLANAETKLRDGVSSVLERKTVDQLLAPGARDAIRAEFAAVAKPFLKGGAATVFIPQYLIQ
jgi:flagellar protein FliL